MAASNSLIDYIYEPVQNDLTRVESNFHHIAQSNQVQMDEFLTHVLPKPGKRIRPAITLLSSRFHPNTGEIPIVMATSVELLHIASLIHDDSIDRSSLRHGAPTISNLWGHSTAVLVGDYLFATAAIWACDTGSIRVLRRFSETIQELSVGELMESHSAFDLNSTYKHYWERTYNKTASLFRTAAQTGAILSGVEEEHIQNLTEYGRNLGMAFQIVDDILDFEGTEDQLGKPVGADLLQGTLTLPAILLMERYPDDNPVPALFRGENTEANSKRAVEMIQNSSIIADSNKFAAEFCDKAVLSLSSLAETRERRSLEELASYILDRKH